MTPNDPTAQGLATMASAGFEFGGDPDQVAHDVRTMWEQLGRPTGAFDAAARAIAALPQRPEVPIADQARRRAFERAGRPPELLPHGPDVVGALVRVAAELEAGRGHG
ncbi:hypothetical protein ACEN85_16310, partial [Curtobacterium sp. CT11-45]|uniref:hypothetical protein n=1 Tax=Curtobacterium sp. CT11-45 TaxID=3243037 RepID=UPI0039AF1E35